MARKNFVFNYSKNNKIENVSKTFSAKIFQCCEENSFA